MRVHESQEGTVVYNWASVGYAHNSGLIKADIHLAIEHRDNGNGVDGRQRREIKGSEGESLDPDTITSGSRSVDCKCRVPQSFLVEESGRGANPSVAHRGPEYQPRPPC